MIKWLKKLKQIYQGWKNDAFVTPEILDMANPRAVICAGCPLNVNGICSSNKVGLAVKDFSYNGEQRFRGRVYTGCGCPLSKKTKSPDSKCPIGNW